MRLPWVSRASYDAVVSRAEKSEVARLAQEAHVSAWMASMHSLRELHDSLLTKYHQLKLQGFTLPPEPRIHVTTTTPTAPEMLIGRAIDSLPASRDPKNRAAMWAQVNEDRANGVTDAEIILRIQRGNRPAEESV